MKMVIVLVILLELLSVRMAYAGNFASGNDLYKSCGLPGQDTTPFCHGYIAGLVDAVEDRVFITAMEQFFCLQDGMTTAQLSIIVKKHLHDNPGKLHWSGASLTAIALHDAFPCDVDRSRSP